MNTFRNIAVALIVIGGINWGLVGFFQYNLVSAIFGGNASAVSRIIYALVGLSAVYYAFTYPWSRRSIGVTDRETLRRVA